MFSLLILLSLSLVFLFHFFLLVAISSLLDLLVGVFVMLCEHSPRLKVSPESIEFVNLFNVSVVVSKYWGLFDSVDRVQVRTLHTEPSIASETIIVEPEEVCVSLDVLRVREVVIEL